MNGMQPVIAGVSPQDLAGVHALLAVIADPAASKARLDELTKVAADASDKMLKAQDAERAAVVAQQRAEEARVAQVNSAGAQHDELERRKQLLDTKEADVQAREGHVSERENALTTAETDNAAYAQEANALMARLKVREQGIADKEQALNAEVAKVTDMRARIEQQLAAIKGIAA